MSTPGENLNLSTNDKPAPVTTEKIELDAKRYVDFIEVDLWSRFQKRLWTLVAAITTVVGLAGIFGLPVIIENKVNSLFTQRSKQFDENIDHYFALYRTYFLLEVMANEYRSRFQADIAAVTSFLTTHTPPTTSDDDKEAASRKFAYGRIAEGLTSLVSQRDASKSLGSDMTMNDLRATTYLSSDIDIPISEKVRLEMSSLSGSAASSFVHPFRNGKLTAFITDIQLRLAILAAFEKSINALREEILTLGSSTSIGKSAKKLEVESYLQTKAYPDIIANLGNILKDQTFRIDEGEKYLFNEEGMQKLMNFYLQEITPEMPKFELKVEPKTQVIDAKKTKPEGTEDKKDRAGSVQER
jgi:hypothetical protein